MQQKKKLLLGAHISIAGGFEKALIAGESIGCTAIQIFTKSNRQWAAKNITQQDANLFKETWEKSNVTSIIAHASYLINIGSPNEETSNKSTKALAEEISRCDALGIRYLVVHPGSHLQEGIDKCILIIARNLDTIFDTISTNVTILLETMAGQGSSIGYHFEQIARIRTLSKYKAKIGACFDTCHAFAAGYDFTTKKTYEHMWNHFDKTIGLEHLYAIHMNDSKRECGSRIDRHQDIGLGKLGLLPFEFLINDPRFFDIPKILETPKTSLAEDLKNMETLKNLISDKTKKILTY